MGELYDKVLSDHKMTILQFIDYIYMIS